MHLNIVPEKYNLPDYSILDPDCEKNFHVWQPDDVYIVLGRANNIEKAVKIDEAISDSIRIFQRPTGGESVILSPQMVVFSARFKRKNSEKPSNFFSDINHSLIYSLSQLGIKDLSSKGISDISIGDKKIMGSSMYLNGETLFYHAVINVSEEVSLISKYLKHPTKEPGYRKGRTHDEFVTSLHREGYLLDNEVVIDAVVDALTALENN